MNEKRKFNRWHPVISFTSDIMCAGRREQANILDISAAGMRVFLTAPVEIGVAVTGKLVIPYSCSRFYVVGEVTRIREADGIWETAVRFDKVRNHPFAEDTSNYLLN